MIINTIQNNVRNSTLKIFVLLFIASLPELALCQTGEINGIVTSEDGRPVHGAFIELKTNKKITLSRQDGSYHFSKINLGKDTIIISLVGKKSIRQSIDIKNQESLTKNFILIETAQHLTEIIISANSAPNNRSVTIGKIPIKPMDLPQAVVTISKDIIRNQQAQQLSDVVKNINGVYLGTARASTQERFFARGYSFGSTNMFKNGSRVNSGAMPEISSLEKVEVLKGGAAILYGNVAPGGVLNMVTKKPLFQKGGEVMMRTGSHGLFKPVMDVYGPLNKHIAFRVNATYEHSNSFRDEVSSTKYYVNPSFIFQLGQRTELILEGDYLHHDFTPDFGIGSIDNNKIPDVPRSRFMGASWQYNKTRQATTSATINHNLNEKWQLNVTTSWQEFNRDYYAVERIQADINGKWARPLGRTEMSERYLSGQVNLNGNFSTGKIKHTLLAGMDADRYNTSSYDFDIQKQTYDTINLLDPSAYVQRTDIPIANRIDRVDSRSYSLGIYVQDLISLSEKIKLLAGVRWSQQQQPANETYFLTKDSLSLGMAQSDNAFSPRIGLVYRVKPNMSLFGSYSNSFMVNTGMDIYQNSLPPSIIDQYELGIKNIFFDEKFTVNITAYKIINSNLAQTAQFDKNGLPNSDTRFKELTGQTTSAGIEFDITARPVKGLSVMGGYSYNNMRYTKTPDTRGSYVEGQRLVSTPAHTANATAFYIFQNGGLNRFRLGVSGYYTGNRFGGWNDTKGQSQNYSRLIPVSGFFTLDLSAGYSIGKVSFMVKLSNLTNTYNYYVHENYSINPIPPRQWISTVSYKF